MARTSNGNKRKPRRAARRVSTDEIVGRKLRLRREAIGLDKRSLAKAIGITPRQLNAFETGKVRVGPALLVEIAKVLRVGITWFFLEQEDSE